MRKSPFNILVVPLFLLAVGAINTATINIQDFKTSTSHFSVALVDGKPTGLTFEIGYKNEYTLLRAHPETQEWNRLYGAGPGEFLFMPGESDEGGIKCHLSGEPAGTNPNNAAYGNARRWIALPGEQARGECGPQYGLRLHCDQKVECYTGPVTLGV